MRPSSSGTTASSPRTTSGKGLRCSSCSLCFCDNCSELRQSQLSRLTTSGTTAATGEPTNGNNNNNNNNNNKQVSFAAGTRTEAESAITKTSAATPTSHAHSVRSGGNGGGGTALTSERFFKKHKPTFLTVKIFQLLCAIYIIVVTFSHPPVGARDPITGNVIDVNSPENTAAGVIYWRNAIYRPIVAQGHWQLFCLAISRMSAFSMYPPMVLIFITKCKTLINWLETTPASMWMLKDFHELHIYCGTYIAYDIFVHTLFHLLRYANQGNLYLVVDTSLQRTGLTGLIVVIATPLICFPMMYFKEAISYEIRKAGHYLFYLFAVGMALHVPPAAVPNGGYCAYILPFCIILYTLDTLYVWFFMTERIDTTRFSVLPTGVQMTMEVSDRFQRRGKNGGFAYVCLPWTDRNQWHAFSLFESSTTNLRHVFMLNTGNWTNAVHEALQRNTVRPVWVCGPFASPYGQAKFFDNQILIASGIGITPALSVIRSNVQKASRRINLIWATRDPHMLEFFLEHLVLDNSGWNLIFYTGKEPLNPVLLELNNTSSVKILTGRPDLMTLVPSIIHSIESEKFEPEQDASCRKCEVIKVLLNRLLELDSLKGKMYALDDDDKLRTLRSLASELGFQLTDLFRHLDGNDDLSRSKKSEPLSTIDEDAEDVTASLLQGGMDNTAGHFLNIIREFGEKHDPVSMDEYFEKEAAARKSTVKASMANLFRLSTLSMDKHKPWEKGEETEEAIKFCKCQQEAVLDTWGMLYCGGAPAVEKQLKEISKKYKIALNSESFSW